MRISTSLAPVALAISLVSGAPAALAQDSADAREAEPQRPAATIADMAWIEGNWAGKGIGGLPAGETFTFAGEQQMVGHFWQLDADGGIDFYELITVIPDGDSLTMRLKHFTADLTGWEAKEGDAALEFPMVERSEDRWKFGPVTFTRDGPDRLDVSVRIRMDDGSLGSFDFEYERVLPD